ncbi:hypothetical protein [Polaromonas sp.]|uniref:hypothetical protein n=1 Tax=Polaromonas sp. TaxID=1869339 RepID=UPI00180A804B|nr:hypothetical protein [Polaromonas sp.]NMM04681.1 hypothetical protein [Polaromonas sp.]
MIYKKTELGKSALQDRSPGLTRHQRSVFIMFDGKRTTDEVVQAMGVLGVTTDDVNHLLSLGLIEVSSSVTFTQLAHQLHPVSAPSLAGAPSLSAQEHYLKLYPIATRLTAGLGLRGFRLNLAVEAAADVIKLQELAPKIKEAVGPEKFKEFESALHF